MKRIFAPLEKNPSETRAALSPVSVKKLCDLGLEVSVEKGIGLKSDYSDKEYEIAGAKIVADMSTGYAEADIIARVRKPEPSEMEGIKPGTLHISFLDPFNETALIGDLAKRNISAISMEMIPRSTLAQKMDALSSQANLAGYAAVTMATDRMTKILPMMMTPSGTISPARFFIIGVGVAGLQAIATAKRLGARVEAFDTRPVVEEQVKSLGAKFVKVDLGEMGQTDQGYAKELTPEQLEKQRQEMAKACARADVVITTAKLFGRKAPLILNNEVLDQMQPGSILIDLAVESGGNVEGSKVGEEVVTKNGVRIIGPENLEGYYPKDATLMLASNFYNLIEHFWDAEAKDFKYDAEDEILNGCLITKDGAIVHERFKNVER
ncbi:MULTISPECIES: NAD(P) transhydrogenase subunit alpha [unclassified Lentimonas]|uniref:NAD(P) transhydrogenase subunit alpha n=1 Tax=unclassified Lentimonas TaxID=2630993 RepID=UPI001329EE02|nr:MULTISPECIES: NAD(P) transhydrogenase subunit alpha [unclassified Lentimonas]CAA6694943.1 NAD(P) transhydrogenase alpha subunit (EC [Lentimonas sp. CC19]CAA6695258.1 NAD(P) transhydrogenase alpha subunit (EC [Lentimonas sp. CC10]CAA7071976.1 NAD(P) transhydrogenase alpha subunit (EC [Lentimonas sp. CC11]